MLSNIHASLVSLLSIREEKEQLAGQLRELGIGKIDIQDPEPPSGFIYVKSDGTRRH